MQYRYLFFPLAALVTATPARAQISANIHIDIPIIGHRAPAYRPREIVVVQYSPRSFGDWRRDYRRWEPVSLYFYGGRFYEQPWGDARRVVVYRYGNSFFFPPRDREWDRYDSRYDYRYRPDGYYHDDRYDRRDDHRDDRYDGRRDHDRYDGRNDDHRGGYDNRGDDRRNDDRRGNDRRNDDNRNDRGGRDGGYQGRARQP